jgi:hypothetical protein
VTLERTTAVLLNGEQWQICAPLVARADVAARRHAKAPPGDRREALSFEQLADQIERVARGLADRGEAVAVPLADGALATTGRSWVTSPDDLSPAAAMHPALRTQLEAGGAVIELRDPLAWGEGADVPDEGNATAVLIPPAEVWRPADAHAAAKQPPQAVLWESQLAAAARGEREPLVPSNISNRILTEGLRRYVDGDAPVSARVVYQDGSEALPFPLRCLTLQQQAPREHVLRLALISMRHNEMDDAVDGCVLRNRVISRVRPAAETDHLAYSMARQRLQALARKDITIELFQTGFQPAVIGFYRALVEQLCEAPRAIAVWPQFHIHDSVFRPGLPWAVGR